MVGHCFYLKAQHNKLFFEQVFSRDFLIFWTFSQHSIDNFRDFDFNTQPYEVLARYTYSITTLIKNLIFSTFTGHSNLKGLEKNNLLDNNDDNILKFFNGFDINRNDIDEGDLKIISHMKNRFYIVDNLIYIKKENVNYELLRNNANYYFRFLKRNIKEEFLNYRPKIYNHYSSTCNHYLSSSVFKLLLPEDQVKNCAIDYEKSSSECINGGGKCLGSIIFLDLHFSLMTSSFKQQYKHLSNDSTFIFADIKIFIDRDDPLYSKVFQSLYSYLFSHSSQINIITDDDSKLKNLMINEINVFNNGVDIVSTCFHGKKVQITEMPTINFILNNGSISNYIKGLNIDNTVANSNEYYFSKIIDRDFTHSYSNQLKQDPSLENSQVTGLFYYNKRENPNLLNSNVGLPRYYNESLGKTLSIKYLVIPMIFNNLKLRKHYNRTSTFQDLINFQNEYISLPNDLFFNYTTMAQCNDLISKQNKWIQEILNDVEYFLNSYNIEINNSSSYEEKLNTIWEDNLVLKNKEICILLYKIKENGQSNIQRKKASFISKSLKLIKPVENEMNDIIDQKIKEVITPLLNNIKEMRKTIKNLNNQIKQINAKQSCIPGYHGISDFEQF
ncbi:hypothetical protein ACTA71_003771 [Dictyostelium dimigraforme]